MFAFATLLIYVLGTFASSAALPAPLGKGPSGKNRIDFGIPAGPYPHGVKPSGRKENLEPWEAPLLKSKLSVHGTGAVDLLAHSAFTTLVGTDPVEKTVGDIESYKTGYATLGGACAEVQKGTEVTLTFDIDVKAVTTREIMDYSKSFSSSLNETEKKAYDKEKQHYEGGLNIPFLEFFGLNLGASYDKEKIREHRESTKDYDERLKEVTDNMKTSTNQNLRISGSLRAIGYSRFPTKACAFITVAQVTYKDGTKQAIVSSDNNDIQARDPNTGQTVPSYGKESNIGW